MKGPCKRLPVISASLSWARAGRGAFSEKTGAEMQDMTSVLSGQTEDHLITHPTFNCAVHRQVVEPLDELSRVARAAGFELAVVSSFRSFSQQCAIWNEKATGRRPVLNDAGEPVRLEDLDEWGRVQAILRWSALPGASRHHWGTDLDVFDRQGLSDNHPRVQLTAAECEAGGPFHDFHQWLSQAIQDGEASGFYRPYDLDRGGVGCEPWHISYAPLSLEFQQALDLDVLRPVLGASDIALRDTVVDHMDEIFSRYIRLPLPLR